MPPRPRKEAAPRAPTPRGSPTKSNASSHMTRNGSLLSSASAFDLAASPAAPLSPGAGAPGDALPIKKAPAGLTIRKAPLKRSASKPHPASLPRERSPLKPAPAHKLAAYAIAPASPLPFDDGETFGLDLRATDAFMLEDEVSGAGRRQRQGAHCSLGARALSCLPAALPGGRLRCWVSWLAPGAARATSRACQQVPSLPAPPPPHASPPPPCGPASCRSQA